MPFITPRSVLAEVEVTEQQAEVINRFKEVDLTPEHLSLKIQGDRVIYILNRCLAKMNMLAHLPFLLQNDAEHIRKFLNPSEAFFVLEVLSEWGLMFTTSNIKVTEYIADYLRLGTVNRSAKKQATSNLLPEAFPNPQIYQLVDIVFYNKCIQNAIRTAENPKVDKSVMRIIKYLQELKEIVKTKIYVTGEEEKNNERELRKAHRANISLTAHIKEFYQRGCPKKG